MLKKLSKTVRFALISLLAVYFTGCTSVPMPKGNSKGYSTVRFITPNEPLGTDSLPAFVAANTMIKKAIMAQLKSNGLEIVTGNSDLIVAHLIILQDNISTSYSNQYFGLQDSSDIVTLAHKKGMKTAYPEAVQKRILVIDFIDAKTYKLVYRDYTLTGALANLSKEDQQRRIDKMVAETLQRFFK